jgi:hypothetical protein
MDLEQLEKELESATENLTKLGRQMKASAKLEAEKHSDYDLLKNKLLVILYNEEVEQKIKRTVDQRQALYRTKYAEQRRDWLLAKADYESDRDLFRGLLTKITALQSLMSNEREKMRLV